MPSCDSSGTFAWAVRLSPSPTVLLPGLTAGVSEVSRFSCMKFIGVTGVFDYAGPIRDSRYRPCSCCHSPIFKTVASGMIFSELDTHPTYPLSTLRGLPHDRTRPRLEAEVARYSFLVRLFHPLPHAGLSRRTKIAIALTDQVPGVARAASAESTLAHLRRILRTQVRNCSARWALRRAEQRDRIPPTPQRRKPG